MGVGTTVFAANIEIFDETELGAKIDVPNLIKITENSSIGVEAGVNDLHHDWKDDSFAFVKYTYRGSLFDFTKR